MNRTAGYDSVINENTVQQSDRNAVAKALIIDDVTMNTDILIGLLKPYNLHIDSVTSGSKAIDIVREEKEHYDIIFMDYLMPDIDGVEAVMQMRAIGSEYARNVPVIAFTANEEEDSEQFFADAGFQGYIPKPIKIVRLDSIIRRWLGEKYGIDALIQKPASQRLSSQQPPSMQQISSKFTSASVRGLHVDGLDMGICIEHFGGDEELFFSVLRSFCVNTPPLITRARKVDINDLQTYAFTIHSIKGSCRTIVAQSLAERAEKLEKSAKSGDFLNILNNNTSFLDDITSFIAEIKKQRYLPGY